jgi:phosphohistidine phosphatase
MVRELVIVRHAEAAMATGGPDAERPLTAKGEQDALDGARWIKGEVSAVDRVVASPAVRARQTAHSICGVLGIPREKVRWVDQVYAATVAELVEVIEEQGSDADRVMLVGHNPGLVELVRHLLGPRGIVRRLSPAGVVWIRLGGGLRESGRSELQGVWSPGR